MSRWERMIRAWRPAAFLGNITFEHQIRVAVTLGILLLAFISFMISSWQATQRIREDMIAQGMRITESLGKQSLLALLTASPENAEESVNATLAFPGVISVGILLVDGQPLLQRSKRGDTPPIRERMLPVQGQAASLVGETDQAWRFDGPVYSQSGEETPFQVQQSQTQRLGTVSVVVSKEALEQLTRDLLVANLLTSLIFALILLATIGMLTRRVARPLNDLSANMIQAEAGWEHVRATPAGPKDIRAMAHIFNNMMQALEDRESELRIARDKALAFARLKAEFAATVSHEIRTPMNGVIGMLEILKAMNLPRQQREFVDVAWGSARSLLELINDILDFSKLDAGKMELEQIEFDLRQTLEDVVELFAVQAHQKGLELGCLVDAKLPMRFLGDPKRLRQVLANLLSNAVKFTHQGEVAVRATPTASGWVRFEVQDTGIGIAPDVHSLLFESFSQADPSTTRRYGGTGLGLAISRQLVELMGGAIGLESEPGSGSSFWLEVPFAAVTGPDEQPPALSTLKILVVDECDIAADFLTQTLADWGMVYTVERTADDAIAALLEAQASASPFDLVILDSAYAMVAGGGLVRRIRGEPGLAALQVVVMDKLNLQTQRSGGVPWDADAYLAKPLRAGRLRECLRSINEETKPLSRSTGEVQDGAEPDPSCRVLVVEDNRSNQAVAQGMLNLLGCRSKVAGSGREALEMLDNEHFDLVLMDCNMPEMDGYETTMQLRQQHGDGAGHLPVVAMTANTRQADVERCLTAGMDDHMSKPLTLERLIDKIEQWTGRSLSARHHNGVPSVQQSEYQGEPLDRSIFAKLREILGETLGEMVRPFLEDTPHSLQALEQALLAEDLETARQSAHAVRGSAGNLGALGLAALARHVEEQVAGGELQAALEQMQLLNQEYDQVAHLLERELSQQTSEVDRQSENAALILVVDDDRSTRAALRYTLQREGFQVEEAANGEQALEMAGRFQPDAILLDAMMPNMDGFTVCAKLKETPAGAEIPVIMVTALEDTGSIERAFTAGASDYIPKPVHLAVVSQRIQRIVDASRAERHVRHLAYNDTLTGLPNRVMFMDHLEGCIAQAAQLGQQMAVLFLDLDRFKNVNDTLGHDIGDRLLISVARRLKHSIRDSDFVARFGGDEFAITLENLTNPLVTAASAAQKIIRALTAPFEIVGHDIYISTSIGISITPYDGSEVTSLLKHADTAMYRAKKTSSGYAFYEYGMEANLSAQVQLENALRHAIGRDELVLYYQPKVRALDGELVGIEALVRWQHPQKGLISPMEFIPVAEETGLIVPVGEWVMRSACRQVKEWLEQGLDPCPVAVNLSAFQINQHNFVDSVANILDETGLPPQYLELEITESVLMEQAKETLVTLQRLKQLGVSLSIDDFGTGYSSLSYLKRFPVDILKIDRSFVSDAHTNPDDGAIVSGIIALAHSLRLQVVAEGVEESAQREFLIAAGCDFIQGYLLSCPIPAEGLQEQFLGNRMAHPGRMLPDQDDIV